MIASIRSRAARVSATALVLALPLLARADDADPFTATVTTATTKVGTYGAALVGLAAVGVGFGIAIKYVKKVRGAA